MLKIQEALRVTQKANVDFHKDAGELALTQDKIMQLFIGPDKEIYVEKGKKNMIICIIYIFVITLCIMLNSEHRNHYFFHSLQLEYWLHRTLRHLQRT